MMSKLSGPRISVRAASSYFSAASIKESAACCAVSYVLPLVTAVVACGLTVGAALKTSRPRSVAVPTTERSFGRPEFEDIVYILLLPLFMISPPATSAATTATTTTAAATAATATAAAKSTHARSPTTTAGTTAGSAKAT